MVRELIERCPDIHVAPGEGPRRAASTLVAGIDHLPVVLPAAA